MTEWLRRTILENLGLKVLALVFSVAFFSYVHGQEDVQNKTLPVTVVSLPPEDGDQELVTPIPVSVHVTLRGPARALQKLIQDGLAPVEIDLRRTRTERLEFSRDQFLLPEDVELIAVDPPVLLLRWETVVTRRIPLQASLTGQPMAGHVLVGQPHVDPAEITVRGPISQVEVLQFARLESFDVEGLSAGHYSRRIALDPPTTGVRYLGSQSATVSVQITEQLSERVFLGRPVEVIGPPHAMCVPRVVDVTVIGPPDVVRALRDEQVVPQADLHAAGRFDPAIPHAAMAAPVSVHLADAECRTQPPTVTVKW